MMLVKTLKLIRPAGLVVHQTGQVFIDRFTVWSWRVLGLAALAQGLLWSDLPNLFAIVVILAAWKLITAFVLPAGVFNRFPLSSFLVLAYGLTQFYFPLLFTLLEAKPVTFNLALPYSVFFHSLLGIAVVVSSHILYRSLSLLASAKNNLQRLLWRAKLFSSPTTKQIWLMGGVGLLAMLYFVLNSQGGRPFSGNANKFVEGLIPFCYAPFYLLLRPLFGRGKTPKKTTVFLVLYSVCLFAVSIMRNSRGAFMFGFAGLGFSYGLGLLLNMMQPKFFTAKNMIAGLLGIWLLTGPLSDLGTAMVITREQRSDVAASELLARTIDVYKDKKAIRDYVTETSGQKPGEFDEYYLNNLFLSRFCNLKYNDLSLGMAEKLGGINAQCIKHTVDGTLSILPKPLLALLGVDINKEEVNAYSNGDLMIYLTSGQESLGWYMIGHFAGFGMASFGWWYLLLLFVLLLPVFLLWDTLAVKVNAASSGKRWVFSLTALLFSVPLFQFMNFESVLDMMQFMLRSWLQMIFLYLLLFHITALFFKQKGKRQG